MFSPIWCWDHILPCVTCTFIFVTLLFVYLGATLSDHSWWCGNIQGAIDQIKDGHIYARQMPFNHFFNHSSSSFIDLEIGASSVSTKHNGSSWKTCEFFREEAKTMINLCSSVSRSGFSLLWTLGYFRTLTNNINSPLSWYSLSLFYGREMPY